MSFTFIIKLVYLPNYIFYKEILKQEEFEDTKGR
jgi:hypothetical protein